MPGTRVQIKLATTCAQQIQFTRDHVKTKTIEFFRLMCRNVQLLPLIRELSAYEVVNVDHLEFAHCVCFAFLVILERIVAGTAGYQMQLQGRTRA